MFLYKSNRIPLFSIVLCTYNRGYIIEDAIKSVFNQIEEDWELIIVDDGSSDDTSAICRKYVDSSEKIRYIYQKNKGLPFARNVGIFASSGLYVTFLDSDDTYKDNHLSIRKMILLQNPDVEFLHGGLEIIGDEYVPDSTDRSKKIHISECYVGGTFFIRREKLFELGGFRNLEYAEDSDLALRAFVEGVSIASVGYQTYIYNRTLPDSICNKR